MFRMVIALKGESILKIIIGTWYVMPEIYAGAL